MPRKYTTEQAIKSFWNRVIITANDNQCWLWKGAFDNKGYGNKYWNGKFRKAHQVAWILPNYVIPRGMEICHSCDNPACVNPKHLFLGTRQDNVDDMVAKNRGNYPGSKGEKNGNRKLRSEDVIAIRQKYATGNISYQILAQEFGLTKAHIGRIVKRKLWKEL